MYMEGVTQAVMGVNLHYHVEPCWGLQGMHDEIIIILETATVQGSLAHHDMYMYMSVQCTYVHTYMYMYMYTHMHT